jgi:hypothetical protein
MHIGVVSIEGDHRREIPEILARLRYTVLETFRSNDADQASEELEWGPDRNKVAKVVYFSEGFTHIVDPEMVLMGDSIWLECSLKWGNRVIGWICEGASGSYGITVYESGRKIRNVFRVDGEIKTNEGEPLVEEFGLNWEGAWETDVLELADQLGASFDMSVDREYEIYYLDESAMA